METLTATVQYGDFTGEAKADNADRDDIQVLAGKYGVKGYVVGASFYAGERGHIQIYVYTMDTSAYDDIEAQAKANGGTVTVKQHRLEGVTIEEFLAAFKRFSVALRYRYESVKVMQYETD